MISGMVHGAIVPLRPSIAAIQKDLATSWNLVYTTCIYVYLDRTNKMNVCQEPWQEIIWAISHHQSILLNIRLVLTGAFFRSSEKGVGRCD